MMLTLRSLGFITVFVDEYSHNDKSISRYGWARAGYTAHFVHANRQKCIQTVVAVSEAGLVHSVTRQGTFNGRLFAKFLQELLQKL